MMMMLGGHEVTVLFFLVFGLMACIGFVGIFVQRLRK